MSEQDYQRGLRGGSPEVFSSQDPQRYDDWHDGNMEYQRQQIEDYYREEREMDQYYSPEEQTKRYEERIASINYDTKKRMDSLRESAYKRADDNISGGILFGPLWFFIILIPGYILQWFLDFFKVHIPSMAIWGLAILIVIIVIWESSTGYKKDKEEAYEKYGNRYPEKAQQEKVSPKKVKAIRVKAIKGLTIDECTRVALAKYERKKRLNE